MYEPKTLDHFMSFVCLDLAEKIQGFGLQINKTNSQMSEEQTNQNPKVDAQNLIREKHQVQREINTEDIVHEQKSIVPGEIVEAIDQQAEIAHQNEPEKQQDTVEAQANEIKLTNDQASHLEYQAANPSINQQKQENIDIPPIDYMPQSINPTIMQSRKTIQSKIYSENTVSNLAEPKVEAQQLNIASFQQTYSLNQKIFIEHPKQETKDNEQQSRQPSKVKAQHLSIESNERQKYRLQSEVVESIQEEREKKVVQFVEFTIQEPHKIIQASNTIKQGQSMSAQTQNKELNFSFSDKEQAKPVQIQQKSNSLRLHNQTIKIDNARKNIGRIAKKPLHQKKIHDAIVLLQRNDPKKMVIPRLEESPKKQDRNEIDLSKLDTHITLNSNILNITIGELMSKQSSQAGILLEQIQQLKQKLFEMEYTKRREDMNEEDYYSPSHQSPSEYNHELIDQENILSNKHNNRQSLGKFYRKIENNHSKLSEQLRRAGLATQRKGNSTMDPDSSKSKPRFSSAEVFQKSDSNQRDRTVQSKGPVLFRVKKNNKNLGGFNIDNEEKQRQVGFIKTKEKSDEKDKCFQAKRDNPKLQFTEQEIMNIIEKPVQRQLKLQVDFRQQIERYFLDLGEQIPKRDWSQQQLVNLAKLTFRKFGVNIEMEKDLTLHIKKYKNCVQFVFDSSKTILWYYDGKFYYGGWVVNKQGEGEKSGWGYNFSPGKFVYSGNFKNNKREGYGIMKFLSRDNDTIYEGFWQNGFKNGLGKQKEADESNYIGQWQYGKKHGKGKCLVSPIQMYEGDYSNGLKHGFGRQCFENGDSYIGNYYQGKFHGSGVYTWANFSKYEGYFRDGLRNGNGKWISDYRDPKSDQYQGQYSNDKKSGFGLYKWKDGTIYQGQFLNDLKHGQGVVSYGDGKSTRLEWFEGNIVSQQTPVDKIKPKNRNISSKQSSQRSQQSKNLNSKPPLVKFNLKSTSKSKPNRSSARIQQI